MSYPATPNLSLAVVSSTSFTATVSGADPGGTVRLYYRQVGALVDTTGPTISGTGGSATVSGLTANAGYLVYAVGDDGSGYSLPALAAISLATTDSLSGALTAALANNAGFASLCPQVWDKEVPENVPGPGGIPVRVELPFAVVGPTDEKPEWTFEAVYYDVCQVTISCYATSSNLAEKIRLAAQSAIDWQALPFATATTVQVMRDAVHSDGEDVIDRNGNKVFERKLSYQVMVTRSL